MVQAMSLRDMCANLKKYVTIQRFGVEKIFNGSERSLLCSPKLHLFYNKVIL